jgi:flagellar biosynthetic protein FliR
MTGLLVFNPIFSRTNVPTMVNAGLAFVLAILLTGSVSFPQITDVSFYTFTYMAIKEMSVGLFAGFILRMFMAALIMGGETIDMQLGIGMSKIFDPASNASISVSAQLLNIMFVVGFFQSNAHLTLIQMTAKTFDIIPLGDITFNTQNFLYVPELLSLVFLLSIKLCLPILVMEIIVAFAVGMVMRVVPQINVFVISFQLKLLIGLFVMVMIVPAMGAFCENLLTLCLEYIETIWLDF